MRKFLYIISLTLCLGLTTACMTNQGLNRTQIKALQEAGFVYTDDGWTLDMPTSLLFATDEYELSQDTQKKIADLMIKLQAINIKKIIVQGHTDNIGSQQYNQELSLKRAQNVAKIALQHGFKSESVQAVGYADTKPLTSNDTEEGRAENRRVAVIIVP